MRGRCGATPAETAAYEIVTKFDPDQAKSIASTLHGSTEGRDVEDDGGEMSAFLRLTRAIEDELAKPRVVVGHIPEDERPPF